MRKSRGLSLICFAEIRRDDYLFRRDDDDLTVFPSGDGITEAFVHQQRMINGAPQDLLDIFRVLSDVIVGQRWCGLVAHGFVLENLIQESCSRTVIPRLLPPEAIETGSVETELSYTVHASANGW